MRRSLAMVPLLSAALLTAPSQAATVTTTADSGPGSLRDAIAIAAVGETIDFTVSGTITLTSGELLIDKGLTILGPGAGNLTIQRSTASGTPDFRIFNLQSGIGTLSGLTVNNGRAGAGGGINNDSTFTLRDCVIIGNSATQSGGGINNLSTLTLTNCVIRSNSAAGGAAGGSGGGLHNEGTVTATSCTVNSNSASGAGGTSGLGGGINNTGTMDLTNSVIDGNLATGDGGGNSYGGGINNEGTLTVHTSTIGFNSAFGGTGSSGGAGAGGGIANGFGSVTLDRSTVSSNSAAGGPGTSSAGGAGQGGGIANRFGTVIVENSTVSGNAANAGAGAPSPDSSGGGGIFNGSGSLSLSHSTVAANVAHASSGAEGGGLLNPAGVVGIKNTILAANFATVDLFNGAGGDVFSDGFNLMGSTNSPIAPGTADQFNVTAAGLRVGPLRNNGGPTFTHALLCGSPAIDAGDNTNAPATDQRGFPRIVDGVIDIGAYEDNNTAPTISCPAPISFNGAPATGQVVTVSVNVTDANGDPLVVVWTVDGTPFQTNAVAAGGPPTSASVDFTTNFGAGVHAIIVSVSDPYGCATNCSTTVTVTEGVAGIGVIKSCPPALIQPGGIVNVTGTVTNTGNITLTNVNVTNLIAALDGLTRRVLGPITLAPGARMNWTDSYTAPADSCPPYNDTATATGTTVGGVAGVVVTASDTRSCPGTNSPRLFVTRNCPPVPVGPGDLAIFSGIVSNAGNVTLTNVLLVDATGSNTVLLGPIALSPGQSTNYTSSFRVPVDCCTHVTTVTATGTDKCFGRTVADSATTICEAATDARINVTLVCPPIPVLLGELLVFSGVVSNAGNVALANVTVVHNQPSNNTAVLGPIALAPGEIEEFTGSYLVPFDTCATSVLDTVTARATDPCNGAIVTDSASTECPIEATPGLVLTKNCPAGAVEPGGILEFSGTISNAGNVTLTNVLVVNDQPTNNTPVLGPITLAPGQSTDFNGSYTVCRDCCPPFVDALTATGASVCNGSNVTATATAACPGTNSPRIFVTRNCPPVLAAPGDIAVFSGIVSNAGNVTLTNVLVVDTVTSSNTVLLGPITLAPGQSSNYTASFRVPPDCCTYVNAVTATGADKCFGRVVTSSATVVCQTATLPVIRVTKVCPPLPVPLGQPLVFSGVVSNIGNLTLTNVTVVNNQPSNNTPVLGPISLAPGESRAFVGSYLVPIDICLTNISDTLLARGNSICNGAEVSHGLAAECPIIPTPLLVVTKRCPVNPVPLGGVLDFTGSVSNAGNITLLSVIVVNDQPTNNTPVFGPITLQPGQSANFSNSYTTCRVCCPPFVDTLTATGQAACTGSNVVAAATASCPGITTPQLTVQVDCPPQPATQGQLLVYYGKVMNSGDVTLSDVLVTDNQAGYVTQISALGPGEFAEFLGMFTPTNCGPNIVTLVTSTALNACTGNVITNQTMASCLVICPPLSAPLRINPGVNNNLFSFSFLTESGKIYTAQYTGVLPPTNWLTLSNFVGNGGTAIIYDSPATNAQRFYRVLVQ